MGFTTTFAPSWMIAPKGFHFGEPKCECSRPVWANSDLKATKAVVTFAHAGNAVPVSDGRVGVGLLVGDGVVLDEGVLLGDGVLISDGVLLSDGTSNADAVALGDNTSAMQAAP